MSFFAQYNTTQVAGCVRGKGLEQQVQVRASGGLLELRFISTTKMSVSQRSAPWR